MTKTAINKVQLYQATRYNCTHLINKTLPYFNDTVEYLDEDSINYDNTSSSYEYNNLTTVITEEWTDGYKEVKRIHIATTIMFISGIFHILMGIFRLDFLSCYLSEQVMSGFVVGGSVHVLLSQVGDAIGIQLPRRSGAGYLYYVSIIHSSRTLVSLMDKIRCLYSNFSV